MLTIARGGGSDSAMDASAIRASSGGGGKDEESFTVVIEAVEGPVGGLW